MIQLEPEISAEYERQLRLLDGLVESYGPNCLTAIDVLRAHFFIANYFYLEDQGLGGVGPRDINLLLSAVGRQVVTFGGKSKWTDRFDICATLFLV